MMKKKGREFACLISSVSNFFLCQTDPIRVSLLSFPSFLPQGDWISFSGRNMTMKIVHTTQITWDWDQLNSAIKFGFLAIWTLGFASTFTFGELSMEEMFSIYLSNLSNLCKMTTLQSARPNLFLTIGVRCERWPIFVVFAWFSLQWFSPPWPRTIVYHFIQSSRLRLSLQLLLLILPIFWRWRKKPCSSGLLWKGR